MVSFRTNTDSRAKSTGSNISSFDSSEEEEINIRDRLKSERKVALNACNLLKMEIEQVGDFFFGPRPKPSKKDSDTLFASASLSHDTDSSDNFDINQLYSSNTRPAETGNQPESEFDKKIREMLRNISQDDSSSIRTEQRKQQMRKLSSSSEEENDMDLDSLANR